MSLIKAVPTKEEGKRGMVPLKIKLLLGDIPMIRQGKKETAWWITRFGWMLEIVALGRR